MCKYIQTPVTQTYASNKIRVDDKINFRVIFLLVLGYSFTQFDYDYIMLITK